METSNNKSKPDDFYQKSQIDKLKNLIKQEIQVSTKNIEASQQLHSLFGLLPDHDSNWPVSPDFGLKIVRQIQKEKYDLIVELGSGTSTFLQLKSLELLDPNSTNTKVLCFEQKTRIEFN